MSQPRSASSGPSKAIGERHLGRVSVRSHSGVLCRVRGGCSGAIAAIIAHKPLLLLLLIGIGV
jgi:hypothetical protein